MRKDAKIALCVILVLMVLVVIIWGRSPRPDDELQFEQDLATPADTETVTVVQATPPPAPAAPAPELETARRQAPATPPADTTSLTPPTVVAHTPPPAIINHVPERARITHDGPPPPTTPRNALDDLPPAAPDTELAHPTPTSEGAAPAAPPAAPPAKPKFLATHKVVKGDNYTRIARKYYNDGNKWRLIYDANRIPAGALHIGQALKIPNLPNAPATTTTTPRASRTAPTTTSRKPASRTHTVKKGESFYSIARTVYRDPGKWQRLYKHNRARLPKPSDPSSLRVGTVIALPDLASNR